MRFCLFNKKDSCFLNKNKYLCKHPAEVFKKNDHGH